MDVRSKRNSERECSDAIDAGKRGAVRNNSGQPVVDSGPGLRVGPTTSPTAGRKPEACPPNSLSQHKSRYGREALSASAASTEAVEARARGLSLLDSLRSNRNNDTYILWELRERGRKRYCGWKTLQGISGNGVKFVRLDCGTWGCAYCGPRKAKRYKWRIREIAEQERLNKFLTLTLDPGKIEGKDSARYLRKVFNKFRVYLQRKLGCSIKYVTVVEFHRSGIAHLHVLLNRYLPQKWISESWEALGGGKIVHIKQVDVHRISHYLAKYLTKELLLYSPHGSRRVTVSRSIRLLGKKKKSDATWTLLDTNVFHLYSISPPAQNVAIDDEGFLLQFSIPLESPDGSRDYNVTLEVWLYGSLALFFVR